jgi:hypothetical protein
LPIQLKEWVWIEEAPQTVELFRRTESVEEFLKNVADQKESIARLKMPAKGTDVRVVFIDTRPPNVKELVSGLAI